MTSLCSKCPHLQRLRLKMVATPIKMQGHAHRERQTRKHITSHSRPGERHTHAHTRSVNVKVLTLQGPSDPQVHLRPDGNPPLATKKVADGKPTLPYQKHIQRSNVSREIFYLFFSLGEHIHINITTVMTIDMQSVRSWLHRLVQSAV